MITKKQPIFPFLTRNFHVETCDIFYHGSHQRHCHVCTDHGNCSDGVPESVVFLVITCNLVRNKHHRENSDFCCMAIVLVIEFCNYD